MKQQPERKQLVELAIPIAIAALAVALLVGGFMFHTIPVHYTETIEPEPAEVDDTPDFVPVDPWTGDPIDVPQIAREDDKDEGQEVDRMAVEPESRIVLEVTRGGVAFQDGLIKLLYTPGEPPPSLCPT